MHSEKSGRKSHRLFQVLHYHFPEETGKLRQLLIGTARVPAKIRT
jgi:hypothetical protein